MEVGEEGNYILYTYCYTVTTRILAYQPNALPLGQSNSLVWVLVPEFLTAVARVQGSVVVQGVGVICFSSSDSESTCVHADL